MSTVKIRRKKTKEQLSRISAYLFAFLLFFFSGCEQQSGKSNTEADLVAIQTLVQQWCTAVEAGDVTAVMNLYADDIVRMPPDAPVIQGKQAIEEVYRGGFELFSIEVTWPVEGTEEIIVADGWAFHLSEYFERFTPKAGGDTIEERGKIIEIIQQQPDGSWRFAREIWNRHSPQGKE